ncbi:hypothetical protein XELAEV_18019529mg [Xenopus laevis]|uniref:Uncharacterized protein n=1 Tax=Xenopus laevis TaxID=8355 RepID=A0A974DI10_XENLA|nr:hypothetical protein XELAEV_18019529mg [Xenopus laevis]
MPMLCCHLSARNISGIYIFPAKCSSQTLNLCPQPFPRRFLQCPTKDSQPTYCFFCTPCQSLWPTTANSKPRTDTGLSTCRSAAKCPLHSASAPHPLSSSSQGADRTPVTQYIPSQVLLTLYPPLPKEQQNPSYPIYSQPSAPHPLSSSSQGTAEPQLPNIFPAKCSSPFILQLPRNRQNPSYPIYS